MRERDDPQRLNHLIAGAFRGGNGAADRDALAIWQTWDAIVGDQLAARAQPSALRNHVLIVVVSSSSWMQELQMMKERIRGQLNQRLGSDVVRDICFVSGELPDRKVPEVAANVAAEKELAQSESVPLPSTGHRELDEVFADVMAARSRRAAALRSDKPKDPKPS